MEVLTGEHYAVISAGIAGLVTVGSALMSYRRQARQDLSADEKDLRNTLMAEVKRLADELAESHKIIIELQARISMAERALAEAKRLADELAQAQQLIRELQARVSHG